MTWCRMQWDRVLAVALIAAGVVLLIAGWSGASGTEFVADQVPYVVSGGLGGLVLLVVGGTLWVSADLKDEWRKLDRLDQAPAEGDHSQELDELRDRVTMLEELLANARNGGGDVELRRRTRTGRVPVRSGAGLSGDES